MPNVRQIDEKVLEIPRGKIKEIFVRDKIVFNLTFSFLRGAKRIY
jgi:hypothetical protein